MKIAIDISPLESGHKVRGVGFYVKYLKEALERYNTIHNLRFITDLEDAKGADILHVPYFDPFFRHLPFFKSLPIVLTVHDLTPIKFSAHFPVGLKGKANWQINKRIASSADAIITDSMCSSNDVKDIMGISKDRIHTVYLAPAGEFVDQITKASAKAILKKLDLPEKFMLYVGDATWNKNLPRIIEAAIKADLPIIFAGKAIANKDYDKSHPWNKDLVKAQDLIFGYKGARVLGFVSDEELRALYAVAVVLLLPSLYEGFGLPAVEAMASGCPVITSREGSLEEVGGNAVYYVDAKNTDSLADGMRDVFESDALQKQLRKSGLIQSEKFSWKKTALETIDVYEKVALRR